MGEQKAKPDVWYQCLVGFLAIFTLLLLIFTTFVNYYGTLFRIFDFDAGWFEKDIGETSDTYDLDFTPVFWTFAVVWAFIFLFQWGWVIYVVTTLCRRNQFGPVFVNPPVVSPFFLWVYCVNLAVNIAWLFLWDNDLLIWGFVDLILIVATLLMILVSHHRSVDRAGLQLQLYHRRDLLAIRILIQNGIMLYLTWTTIATHIGLGVVMTYEGDVDQSTSSTILLSMLGAIVVIYFILDTFVWDKYLRYTYSFYGVAAWATLGIFVKNWGLSLNAILSLILFILSSILGLVKIALSIMRSRSNPLYNGQ